MRLPRVFAGRRRRQFAALVANGLAQAVLGGAAALWLHAGLAASAPGAGVVAGVLLAAAGVAALRVHAAGAGERLGQDYVIRVRERIFASALASPLAAAQQRRAGTAMARAIGDLDSLRSWVSRGLAQSVVAGATLAVGLSALAWLRPRAGAGAAALVIACALLAALVAVRLRLEVREARRRRGRLAANLGEKLLAARTVRALGASDAETKRLRRHGAWLRDVLVRRARLAEALRVLPELLMPAGITLWLVIAAPLDPREAAAGILLLGTLGAALRDLARALDHRLRFEEGRRRIGALLAAERLRETEGARDLAGHGPVSLDFAGVSHGGVLEDMTLRASAGECVRLDAAGGPAGSLLLALAARLIDPECGEVRVDGVALRELRLDALHAAVQLVSPELPLLRGTVAESVGYGLTNEDGAWLERVACACGLTADPALPLGLATRIAERGSDLAPGLRARITLARALAMRPRLLLVDDPAFASDAGAAEALVRGVALHPTTLIVAAPAASSALAFDTVWRVDGMQVRERRAARPIAAVTAIPAVG